MVQFKNISESQKYQQTSYSPKTVVPGPKRILLLVEKARSQDVIQISSILEASKISYTIILNPTKVSSIRGLKNGKFQVVVMENLNVYSKMDKRNKNLFQQYCLKHSIGLVIFVHTTDIILFPKNKMFNMSATHSGIQDYEILSNSSILHLTRGGSIDHSTIPGKEWILFSGHHRTYQPIAYAKLHSKHTKVVPVIEDKGYLDGIRKIYFGNNLKYWLHIILFLDAVSYLSQGLFLLPNQRYILIDIDDIFVGKTGTRMKPHDVMASIQINIYF